MGALTVTGGVRLPAAPTEGPAGLPTARGVRSRNKSELRRMVRSYRPP